MCSARWSKSGSFCVVVTCLVLLGCCIGHLGQSWAILGSSWGHLGPSWSHLKAILGHLGAKMRFLKVGGPWLLVGSRRGPQRGFSRQDGPRWLQDGPRWPQGGPKGAPRCPKMGSRSPKMAPKVQDETKMPPTLPQDNLNKAAGNIKNRALA